MVLGVVNLPADYGWGPYTLVWIFVITIAVATAGFLIVMASSRTRKKQSFASKRTYHFERYWAIGVAGVLVWLWVNSYPWMPPVAFSTATASTESSQLQVVNVTAGQWFWLMSKNGDHVQAGDSPQVTLVAGQPVEFDAKSVDVNHGFGVFKQAYDSEILFQMQVIPGMDNIFYYTFKQPGVYMVRCLEYCGYAHPYMTSQIRVIEPGEESNSTAAGALIQP